MSGLPYHRRPHLVAENHQRAHELLMPKRMAVVIGALYGVEYPVLGIERLSNDKRVLSERPFWIR